MLSYSYYHPGLPSQSVIVYVAIVHHISSLKHQGFRILIPFPFFNSYRILFDSFVFDFLCAFCIIPNLLFFFINSSSILSGLGLRFHFYFKVQFQNICSVLQSTGDQLIHSYLNKDLWIYTHSLESLKILDGLYISKSSQIRISCFYEFFNLSSLISCPSSHSILKYYFSILSTFLRSVLLPIMCANYFESIAGYFHIKQRNN